VHPLLSRLLLSRALCGCVCWSVALLVTLWGVPGPEASPGSEYAYSTVIRQLLRQAQVQQTLWSVVLNCMPGVFSESVFTTLLSPGVAAACLPPVSELAPCPHEEKVQLLALEA